MGRHPGRTPCKVCGAPSCALELCSKHYHSFRAHGDPLTIKRRRVGRAPCSVCGMPSCGFELCKKHYRAFKLYGDPLAVRQRFKAPPKPPCVRFVPAGEKNPNARLTNEQVLAIMADPRSCSAISAEYNVTADGVDRIRNGKVWTHLFDTAIYHVRLKGGVVRLTASQRESIVSDPRKQTVIAAEYGVTQQLISVIKRKANVNYSK